MQITNILDFNPISGKLVIEVEDIIISDSIHNIEYIKTTQNNTILLFGKENQFRLYKPTSESIRILETIGFLRIHPQYLINKQCISSYRMQLLDIELTDGTLLPVHPKYATHIEQFFNSISMYN
jgi:DNA-binding LytR/AlgR family response regulator